MARTAPKTKRGRLFGSQARRAGSFAMIQPQRVHVTSAARKVIEQDKGKRRSPDLQWQPAAYEAADDVGELGFLLNLKANMVARCEMRPQQLKVDEEGKKEWVVTTDERVARCDAALVGPQGGQAELKRRAALHLSTAGETYLVGTEFGAEGILWEFLSTDEIRIDQSGVVNRKRDGMTQEQLSKDSYIARCWRAHARYTDLADSEVRRVLNLCSEIVILGQMIDAIAKSRLAANILFVPEEMNFSDDSEDEEASDEEGGEDIDQFTLDLMSHLAAPVEDRTSAAALVPLIMRGPGELADKIKVIEIARGLDTWAQDLRREAMNRLFMGLDAPPEIVSGKSSLNHWTAFNVDADFIIKHIVPLGELIADFLTVAYLRPMLHAYEGMSLEDTAQFRYEFDPSPIAARQDEAAAAARLHAEDLLGDLAAVRSAGFDAADMPKPEELLQRRIWKLLTTSPSVFAKALLPLMEGFGNVDVEQLQVGGGNGGGADGVTGTGDPALRPDPALPIEPTSQQDLPTTDEAPGFRTLSLQLVTAADMAVERAVEKAAGRLIGRVPRSNTLLKDRLAAVSKSRCFTVVKPSELADLNTSPEKLLEGTLDGLSDRTRAWVRQYCIDQGVDSYLADERGALAASNLCGSVMKYMTDRLLVGLPLQANGTRIPEALVLEALDPLVASPVG